MANAHITLAAARASNSHRTQPVPNSIPVGQQNMASTGTSAQSTVTAPATGWEELHWSVTAYNGPVWVAFGSNPTASAGTHQYIPSGVTRFFNVSAASEKVAVIDA